MLSVPMIVKDEEERLPRALKSLQAQDAITEIVVLDTGSTDRTVEIAKDHGCRVIEGEAVFYMGADETPDGLPRIHFAACRNKAVSYCTGEWLFTLDGDEWVEGDVLGAVNLAVERNCNGVAIWVHAFESVQAVELCVQSRILRNDGSTKWKYPIHNQNVGIMEPVPVSNAALVKSDYSGSRMAPKISRSLPMLLKLAAEEPNDSHAPWHLMRTYHRASQWQEMLLWAQCLQLRCPEAQPLWAQAMLGRHDACIQLEMYHEAAAALRQLLAYHPHHPDARYIRLCEAFKAWSETFERGAPYFGLGQTCIPKMADAHYIAHYLGVKS